jgi:hypothetical protein
VITTTLGPKHDVVADADRAVVDEGEIEVRVDVVAEVDVPAAPVGVQRRFEVAAGPDGGEHALQQL